MSKEQATHKNVGKVIEVIGPVVDIEFAKGELPEIYNAIEIVSDGFRQSRRRSSIITEVQYHLGENRVRTISMHPTDGLVRGMKARDLGGPITVPVGREVLGRMINVIGDRWTTRDRSTTEEALSHPPRRSAAWTSRTPGWSCSRPASR